MNRGYVKVWRKIEDSGLIQLPNTLALFMHLLLNATHKDRKVGTPTGVIELKRGQYISGRIELAARLKQSEQQIRTSLNRLADLDIITIESTNRFSIYTIENYNKYQDDVEQNNQQDNQQTTSKQPADNQQITTKQELKHLNIKEKDITPLALLESMGIPKPLAKDYIKVRDKARKATTPTAMNAIKKHAEQNDMTFLEAIQICAEKNWVGFDVSWLEKADKKQDLGWRNDDSQILAKAKQMGIPTTGKSRYEILSKIDNQARVSI